MFKQPPNVPVRLERTQKDSVPVLALAVPKSKSATLNPSMNWFSRKKSADKTDYALKDVTRMEFVNPAVATEDC